LKKILISTGGSGGHVVPALNLFQHLNKDFEVKLYSDSRGAKYIPKNIEKTIFEVKQVPDKKYYLPLKVIYIFFSFIKSLIHFNKNKFDIVISTGGYMSLPITLAAKIFKIKIFLFEPNSIIGRSNKFLLNFSTKIFCYDKNLIGIESKNYNKIVEIAPLLNRCFYNVNNNENLNKILKILIIGGSQASLFFTKNIKNEMIKLGSKYNIEVTQQLSNGFDKAIYKKDYDLENIKSNLFYFKEDFLCKENNFDLAITRAGASSLAELAQLNIPFITIPFRYATDNHQYYNAKRYSNLNCGWILEEKNIVSGDIFKIINQIMINKNEYLTKKNNLKVMCQRNNWEYINKKILKIFYEN